MENFHVVNGIRTMTGLENLKNPHLIDFKLDRTFRRKSTQALLVVLCLVRTIDSLHLEYDWWCRVWQNYIVCISFMIAF
jgi:hypothetical protein